MLNNIVLQAGIMSAGDACEMAMQGIGAGRGVLATLAGMFGKLVGRAGDFYRLAGPEVAANNPDREATPEKASSVFSAKSR